jgi:hypothetical protein
VAADPGHYLHAGSTTLDHAVGIRLAHGPIGQLF